MAKKNLGMERSVTKATAKSRRVKGADGGKMYNDAGKGKRAATAGNQNTASRTGAVLVKSAARPESQMTSLEKMEATRQGISKEQLEQLKEKAGLDYDQLAYILNVARATLIGRKGVERFSPALSEKIMSLADIYAYGYGVFGDREAFNQWVVQPLPALGGKAPYDFLDNQYGREEVRHIIGRIAYGVYS
jgi:putative toxin-antitoxin system antitoxin component (TIGR02293 family)